MKELSKSIVRRLHDSNFLNRYFAGNGVDIGGKPDPLSLYLEFFPKLKNVKIWDWEDGDAQFMNSVQDEEFDFVHSSHCLEHLVDPTEGLRNWLRIIKPGGYLVVTVPDEDLYEQGEFPSTFNQDHKHTFTIFKRKSWCPKSINLLDILTQLDSNSRIEKIQLLNSTYRTLPRYDQTLTPVAECGIEFIIHKGIKDNLVKKTEYVDKNTLSHLNQYKDDLKTLKKENNTHKPFNNFSNLS